MRERLSKIIANLAPPCHACGNPKLKKFKIWPDNIEWECKCGVHTFGCAPDAGEQLSIYRKLLGMELE